MVGFFDLVPRVPGTWQAPAVTWTVNGASAASAVADESDTTYIQTPSSATINHAAYFAPANQTIPAGARIRTVQTLVRARKVVSALRKVKIPSILRKIPGTTSGSAQWKASNTFALTTSFADYYSPAVSVWPGPEGGEITQAKLSDSLMGILSPKEGTSPDVRISRIRMRVIYDEQPVVAIEAPVGTITATNSPSIVWTFTDDLSEQYSYEIHIYNALGAEVYSSGAAGENDGHEESFHDLTQGLANGVYTLKIRAAQQWNIGASAADRTKFWSNYATGTFTINVAKPVPPSVLAAADDPNGRIVVRAMTNLNRIPQVGTVGAEDNFASQYLASNCTTAITGSFVRTGNKAVTATQTNANPQVAWGIQDTAVLAGQTYAGSIWNRPGPATTPRTFAVGIRWLNSAGSLISDVFGSNVAEVAGTYVEATCNLTAPASAVTAIMLIRWTGGSNADVHIVDDGYLRWSNPDFPTPTPNGNQIRGGMLFETDNLLRHIDATMEDGIMQWIPHSETVTEVTQTTSTAHEGSQSLQVKKLNSTGMAEVRLANYDYFDVTPGEFITGVCSAKRETNGRVWRLSVRYYDSNLTQVASAAIAGGTTPAAWATDTNGPVTVPALAVRAAIWIEVDAVPANEIHYFDRISVRKVNDAVGYWHDGYYPDDTGPTMLFEYSEDGGSNWKELTTIDLTGLPEPITYYDYDVGNENDRTYRASVGRSFDGVVLRSELSTATPDVTQQIDSVWLHAVDDPQGTARNYLYDGGGRSEAHDATGVLNEYDGREFPLAEFGEVRKNAVTVTLQLPERADSDAFWDLARRRDLVIYRDHRGRRYRAIIQSPARADVKYGHDVTLTISTSGEQPWPLPAEL